MSTLMGRQVVCNRSEVYEEMTYRVAIKAGVCQRCGERVHEALPNGATYCTGCIDFGRVSTDDVLVYEEEKLNVSRHVNFQWTGQRTPYQEKIAQQLLANFKAGSNALLWAVTGAGKTEMLFPLLYYALTQGCRVAIAAPRIDVCRELYPRLTAIFPEEIILLLYGETSEHYQYTQFTLCTTHQLCHFYRAFDLLIVDEVDAFPYVDDSRLHFATQQALKTSGCFIKLSATPSRKSLKNEEVVHCLPLRYHQRPLVEPELIWLNKWENIPCSLKKIIHYTTELLLENFVLIFCPSIAYMEKLTHALQVKLPHLTIDFVHANISTREEIVEATRQRAYDVLLTTMILERGVTFANVSVIVIGANHTVFTKSALVQIAGRVDRKGTKKCGRVLFFYNQQTKAIRQACSEIRAMNRLGAKWLADDL